MFISWSPRTPEVDLRRVNMDCLTSRKETNKAIQFSPKEIPDRDQKNRTFSSKEGKKEKMKEKM